MFFAGILAGHWGFSINPDMLNYAESFGLVLFVYVVSTQKQTENDSTQKYPKGNKNTYDDICCLPIHNLIYFFQIDVAC